MAFDFKKEYKEFYMPPNRPKLVTVPPMNYIAVRGCGDPNEEGGAYKQAVGALYAIAYTIRMSRKAGHEIGGFFEYVVPPLEGFWWQNGANKINYADKASFRWISAIRLPDFVSTADFEWAATEAGRKKKLDCSKAEFLTVDEGLCVQMMHVGPYDDEPASVARMDEFLAENGYGTDFTDARRHHEIYLTDPRRSAPEKQKTVLRHPVRKL
ncbi:MAG: transcriptional regulator [Oscillospiraceae bacterium]|nr:transcriptional regulator [Oscillospiraceae bacterium]